MPDFTVEPSRPLPVAPVPASTRRPGGRARALAPTPPRRPRLLIAITLSELGGAQSCVAQLLPGLTDEYDVVVAAAGAGPLRAQALEAGARFVTLRHMRREPGPSDLGALLELVGVIRRERPAIVHAHSAKAGVLARIAAALCRTPVRVYTSHGWSFRAEHGGRARFYRLVERLVGRLTTVVVCPAETELEAGVAAGSCRRDRAAVIRTGVAVRPAQRRPGRARPTLISVGRMKAPKDFRTLIEALALLGELEYEAVLVGDGPDQAELASLARQRGLEPRVRFAGARDDVAEMLDAADCFVLSSRSECLPVSILEAMAAGLPVVATGVGGVPELVDDGVSGFLAPPGDASALAAALRRVLADADLRRRLGEAGRREVLGRYDLESYRRGHRELYRSLLQASRHPVPRVAR